MTRLLLFGVLALLAGLFLTVPALIVITIVVVAVMIVLRPKREQELASLVGVIIVVEGSVSLLVMWLTAAISLGWFSLMYHRLSGVIFR